MKFILLAIFVLFAAQPLQVASCDMDHGQETGHSQHGSMHGGPMQDDSGQDMDCCDNDPVTPGEGCDSMSHCGACPTGLVAVSSSAPSSGSISNAYLPLPETERISDRSGSPPFRPPIA